jgi:predicted class III extradiol MEMO1 family dioxygenase
VAPVPDGVLDSTPPAIALWRLNVIRRMSVAGSPIPDGKSQLSSMFHRAHRTVSRRLASPMELNVTAMPELATVYSMPHFATVYAMPRPMTVYSMPL